ncbi:MAG: hypothetical protein ACTSU5_12415, partial [Promethearchaeota archaeon]
HAGDYDWVFTVNHHPLYSHGHRNSNITNALEDAMHLYGADVHLSGHVHDYQRLVDTSKNWTHVVTGGGGAHLGHPDPSDPTVNVTRGAYHFMEWTVEGLHAHARAIGEDGSVLDEFDLWTA